MRRAILALLLASTLGAAAPQGTPSVDLYISDLQEQADSLRVRVEFLEESLAYVAGYVAEYVAEEYILKLRKDAWTNHFSIDSTRARYNARTKAKASADSTRDRWAKYFKDLKADSTRTPCRATTKAGQQCKRKAAKSGTLCTNHRKAAK